MSEADIGKFNHLRNTRIFNDLKRRVGQEGIAAAIQKELQECGITFTTQNVSDAWYTPRRPTIAVGDHSQGLEGFLLMGALQRNDLSLAAKPYELTGQFVNAVSDEEENYMLPVMPTNVATDRRGGDWHTKIRRQLFRRNLPTQEEIRQLNTNTLKKASSLIEEEGRFIAIFPTGGVYNAATTPWRNGVGHIAHELPKDVFEDTTILPFQFGELTPRRILFAIAKKQLGVASRPQAVCLTLGKAESLGSIMHKEEDRSPTAITQVLYRRYREEFLHEE